MLTEQDKSEAERLRVDVHDALELPTGSHGYYEARKRLRQWLAAGSAAEPPADAVMMRGPTTYTTACDCGSELPGWHRYGCGVFGAAEPPPSDSSVREDAMRDFGSIVRNFQQGRGATRADVEAALARVDALAPGSAAGRSSEVESHKTILCDTCGKELRGGPLDHLTANDRQACLLARSHYQIT